MDSGGGSGGWPRAARLLALCLAGLLAVGALLAAAAQHPAGRALALKEVTPARLIEQLQQVQGLLFRALKEMRGADGCGPAIRPDPAFTFMSK